MNMNSVEISRRRFLRTYQHVTFGLQLLCCAATAATFVRVLHQNHLPLVFLVLPCLLVVILVTERCLNLHDRYVLGIFTGATTGFVSGFLSNVVNPTNLVVDSFPQHQFMVAVCMLEFLHLPVVCGVIMYTFCLVFSRPPPINILILSLAVAMCGTIIINIFTMMLYDPVEMDVIGIGKSTSILAFVVIFFTALMPAVRPNKQAWLLCACGFALNIYWQTGFFDTVQWNWETSSFPVPGFLTGLLPLFMLNIADLRETVDRPQLRRTQPQYDCEALPEKTLVSTNENIIAALTWHSFSYIVERTSLTFIMQSRGHKGQKLSSGDLWSGCLAMLGILASLTYGQRFSDLVIRVVILMLSLLLYISVTVVNGNLSNGYFLDDAFGMAFLTISVTSDHFII